MEAAAYNTPDLDRWRRATIVATTVAALELVALLGVGALVLAKPIAHAIRHHAVAAATRTAVGHTAAAPLPKRTAPPAKPKLARAQTKVLVLNGNGRAGIAHTEATKLSSLGYRIAGAANAKRQDYATTVVMYAPGYAAEGSRLAHDLGAKVVGPLDGLKPAALHGGELAVVLGAS
jgi:hypothetical protein